MRKTMQLSMLAMGIVVAGAQGYSNPVEGGTTEIVTNQWNVAVPWLMVGGNSEGNSLVVTDGGQVDNQIGYIGNATGSSNNSATVTGAGSVWNSSMELSVGNLGSGNTLTIENGGRVDTANGYVGNNSGNNGANVDGSGSRINATTLHVGHLGSDNSLTVSDGGRVESVDGTIGYWIGADNNTATVQGTNSVWSNSGNLNVGDYASGNQLIIAAGGRTESSVVNLGVQTMSSNNTVTVTGNGSILDAPEIYIGGSTAGAGGTGNLLEVESGGTVATTDLNIYAGNNFNLNNGGTLAVNTNFNAAMTGFNFNSGGTLEIGGELTGMGSTIEDQRAVVLNGADALWNKAGSTLYVGKNTSGNSMVATNGALINSSRGYVGYGSSSSNNTARISGSNAMWNTTGRITVGYQGDDNNLVIENGGQVVAKDIIVSDSSASTDNLVVISGEGSKLTTTGGGGVVVGAGGSNNRIEVMDGAMVDASGGIGYAILGYYAGANNNSMLVDDATVQLKQIMYVGLGGSGNHMAITNGGVVRAQHSIVGRQASSDGNSAIVTGAGSLLESREKVFVGFEGSGNSFVVADGGEVRSEVGYIGHSSGADNNSVLVTGADSVWQNNEALYLGGHKSGASWVDGGTENSLTIVDGGWVLVGDVDTTNLPGFIPPYFIPFGGLAVGDSSGGAEMVIANGSSVHGGTSPYSGHGYIGLSSNETGSVVVSGDGSTWDNLDRLFVGLEGSSNSLTIADGAYVESGFGFIGAVNQSHGNKVRVDGSNTVWNNEWILWVGNDGSNNGLVIENGGFVKTQQSLIGLSGRSDSNTVTVTGAGSTWDNDMDLSVGVQGSYNSLVISNGGRVENDTGSIGSSESIPGAASSNSVLVTGSNSIWQNNEALYLGGHRDGTNWVNGGTGNSLTVEDGGWVQVGDIGTNNIPKHGNLGVVSVGGLSGAEMVVANGSHVLSDLGYIGFDANMSGSVAVMGEGSVWSNTTKLYIGKEGSGSSLRIESGARVENNSSYIGYAAGASNNHVIVSGGGTVWNIYSDFSEDRWPLVRDLFVGYDGSKNTLSISDGGEVRGGNGIIGGNETSDDNTVLVTGAGSLWNNQNFVGVGMNGSRNMLQIKNGARVQSTNGGIGDNTTARNNHVVISGEGSIWDIVASGTRYLASGKLFVGYAGSDNSLLIEDGGRVQSANGDIGSIENANNNRALVTGVGSTWDSGWVDDSSQPLIDPLTGQIIPIERLGILSVGRGGSHNSLEIAEGALVSNDHGIIGETSNAWNNAVSVVGLNSEWRNTSDLYIGGRMSQYSYMTSNGWENSWIDGGQGNSLSVADGGLVSVGRDMHNRNYSTVSIDPGGHISISSNYYQDATSVLRFGVETNAVGAPLNPFMSVGGTAEFEAGATLQYHSNVGLLDFDTFYTNLIVEANQLIIAGVTNANAVDLQALNLDGSLVEVMLWEQDQDIFGLVGRRHLADSAGFTEGSQMAGVSKEIDDLSLLGSPSAMTQINLLNGMSSAQQNAQLTQRYTQGTPTHRHQQSMLGGQKQVLAQSRAFQSGNRSQGATPDGAAGPHKAEQGLRGWMRGYGSWANHDGTDSFSGFDQNVYGTVVGLDRAYGNVLLGVAGGYAHSDLTQDNNDSSDADTGFGVLYGSWGTTDWFGDLNLSYGRSAIQTHSAVLGGDEGDFDADNYAAYLGGGKVISWSDSGLLLTPEVALRIGYYDQEGYNDGSMDVDAYDRWSVQSRLGAALAFEKQTGSVVWKPEVRAYWLHEFNADPDQIGYSLIGGSGRYTFGVQAPDEDILEVGTGLTATIHDRLELALDVDGQYSDRYSALTVGARAMYEF